MIMFRQHNINLLYKIIGLLLFLLTIAFIDNIYVLTALFLLIFPINKKNNALVLFVAMLTFLFLVLKFNDNSNTAINIMLIFDYIVIFLVYLNKNDFISLKHLLFWRKLTYKKLSDKYIKDVNKINKDLLDDVIEKNKLEDDSNIQEIKDRLESKNNSVVFDKLVVNYTRFYKNKNDNYKKIDFNKLTFFYLLLHVIILIIAVVF